MRGLVLILALWLAAAGVPAAAQTVTATTGAVNGVVTDSSRAVVPGVTVSLAGASMIAPQNRTTDEAGAYRFSAIPPGDYVLRFELAGFASIVRDGVHVGLGFTATVDAELQPGGLNDSVTVSGTPVIDVEATAITTHFESETLAALPGSRDIFAVLASTPGVALSKIDVGGNAALSLQDYAAYGLRTLTGMHRNEVEGIRVGGANGANDNYASDFASFAEIAVQGVGHSAAMPVPGLLVRYVSKSGGNRYRGSVYADLQNEEWQATNIDAEQIARGVAGGPGLDARAVNRLERFRDFTADIGGYARKDKAWWYTAYRQSEVAQRYAWLLDTPGQLNASVASGKATYNLSPRQKLIGYLQRERLTQENFFQAGTILQTQTSDALPSIEFPVTVWKGEYNAALSDALYVEARVGRYLSDATLGIKSAAPRIVDVGANTVRGGALAFARRISRPQANGSVSYAKSGWMGSHTLRAGGEYVLDNFDQPSFGYGHPCDCVSTLNNSVPTQVQVLLGPNVSRNDLVTIAAFVDDTWQLHRRITASLGLRLDRYQPGLPEQEGPAGQMFAAIRPVLTFNNWGPRLGMSADLTGDGKTVLKLHYGKFWPYPGAVFTVGFNPNPSGWSRTYRWTEDANASGSWDPGEEGALISVVGGSASTRLDPNIANTHVHQTTAYVEREVAPALVVRTGFVLNARREPYGTVNISRPLSAYTKPVSVVDPGPDGRLGSTDDGATLTAYELTPEALAAAPVNLTTNLPDSNSDYYSWEVTATKRPNARWSLLASVVKTWTREAAMGVGNDFTPNALINTSGGQDRYSIWQAKAHVTVNLPFDMRVIPLVRAQSGTPFARTFVRTLNYGNATIKAEPIGANRTPTIALVDLRVEKSFRVMRARVMGFFDVYNILNSNAEQTLTTSSGSAWLRPTTITGPRILRIGARLDW